MTVVAVYCIEWTEYERGWGRRLDGKSYYATKQDAEKAYEKAFEDRDGKVPDYYVNPSKPFLAEATRDILNDIKEQGVAWRH